MPGAMESILRLKEKGFTQSILSASYEKSLIEQCDALGLVPHMKAIGGLSDESAQKKTDIGRKQLEKLGFFVVPSDTNFLFAKTRKMDGGQLYETLKSRGILVRYFGNPKISQYNRITIGTREQMEVLINTLKEVLL